MDYFGPMVNRAARVESVAAGGQVVMSSSVLEEMGGPNAVLAGMTVSDLGSFKLKGLNDETHILQIMPVSLAERSFVQATEQPAGKKMEDQLKALQNQNDELRNRLEVMGAEIASSMQASKALLGEIHAAGDHKMSLKEVEQRMQVCVFLPMFLLSL